MANAPMLPPALAARTVVAPAAQVVKAVIPQPSPRNPPVERPVAFERAAPPAAATRGPERPTPQLPPPPAPLHRAVPETAVPFEASLGTILFGPDRALAIVDGRIVGIDDEVRGARVLEITSNAVMLRDAQGKLRRLSLSTSR
jgi:hypothetical protein